MNTSSCFKHVVTIMVLMFVLDAASLAQTPQYYNSNTGTSSNSFPFNIAAGKAVNSLFLAGEFNQPTPLPSGQKITTVYFRTSTAFTVTFTNLHILMAQDVITTLTTGAFYPGPYDTVYSSPSRTLTSTIDGWMSITLDRPFNYDPTKSLIIFVGQCGGTGTGMSVRNSTLTGIRRTWSVGGCPFAPFASGDGAMVNFGVDVLPAGVPGWSAQTSGVTTLQYGVKAVSPSIAWAGGTGGVVLRTTNGGTNWTSVGGGAIGTADVNAVDAIDANTAFATTTPTSPAATFIYRTTNGGTNWAQVYTDAGAGAFIDAIHMYDATNGIAMGDPVGGKWVILKTTDGGATWARIATEPNQVATEAGSNNGLATVGTNNIWFCSNNGTIATVYRSTNAGATWAFTVLPFTASFTAGIAFSDAQYGVVGSNGGTAARTTNGGANWSSITVGTTGAQDRYDM